MLRECRDLGVNGLNAGTLCGGLTDGTRVALEGTEDESVNHTLDVALCLSIGEGLIGSGLLQAVSILKSKRLSDGVRQVGLPVQDLRQCCLHLGMQQQRPKDQRQGQQSGLGCSMQGES